jgi:hypothetical protein
MNEAALLERVTHYQEEPNVPFDLTKRRGLPPSQLYEIVRKISLEGATKALGRPLTDKDMVKLEPAIDQAYLWALDRYG